MRLIFSTVGLLGLFLIFSCREKKHPTPVVLIYSEAPASHQYQAQPGLGYILKLRDQGGFGLDTTSNPGSFTDSALRKYVSVIFLGTSGNGLNARQRVSLERYVQAGGGFVTIGLPDNSEYDWAWFRRMAGGMLKDSGRIFNTASGKTFASYTDTTFMKYLSDGILSTIDPDHKLDYTKAYSVFPPEEKYFTKTVLVEGKLFEPTEMTILPDLDILFLQRRGEIMLYSNVTKTLKQIGFLDVYWKTHKAGASAEEGMLGLCKDPKFKDNHWVYIYYSPADSSVNRLSRFTMEKDTIKASSEKVILEVHSQREICCHTGGSLTFGPEDLLFVSTGDNSTPFDEKGARYVSSGFAPLNDLPGHEQYDAERSAGNSNDLRGKILRIKIKDDGTYDIPKGNLFPVGTPRTRPEIYVMGDRNPYRISVDQQTGFLYWGEVGPDAGIDSLGTRGPRGYDEINQAREAGYFGWPFFVGNNYAYHRYDYATGQSGLIEDPLHPVNLSRNNTGLTDLPPAQPAMIWYPYANSPEFPEVGTGGRNAMAGPVYHADMFPAKDRYPDYYNGKFFIYEWIRGWIKVVTLSPEGNFEKMEPFMDHIKLHNCIDMEVGPDGRLYGVEYGTKWFAQNEDAGLFRIDYDTSHEVVAKNEAVLALLEDKKNSAPSAAGASKSPYAAGKALAVETLDCKSCHKEAEKSIGPSFQAVAEKYAKIKNAEALLSAKVIRGGNGVWGDVAMSAHPDISKDDLHKIMAYILSLSSKAVLPPVHP